MATLEEVYQQVLGDDGERAAFVEAAKAGTVQAFAAERGCQATEQEVADFLKEVSTREGELSEAELEGVAGGCNNSEAFVSVMSVGVGCAISAIASAADGEMNGENGRILCADTSWVGTTQFD